MKKRSRFRNIYYDPGSEKQLEGKAWLVRCISEDELYETWEVRFPVGGGDPQELFIRKILKKEPNNMYSPRY